MKNDVRINSNFKFLLISFLFFQFFNVYSQKAESLYTNTNILEVYANSKESLVHIENDLNTGWGFEINSLHGIFILKKLVLSAGVGINFNINEDYKSLPVIAEARFNFNDFGINSPFILLNTGRNIKIGSFLPGQTAKLGFGYNFESDSNFQYTIEFLKKSKTYYTNEIPSIDYDYRADGYGISIGINL